MADAENALISTQVKMGMKMFSNSDTSIKANIVNALLPDLVTEIVKKAGKLPDNVNMEPVSMKFHVDDSMAAKYPSLKKLAEKLEHDTANTRVIIGGTSMEQGPQVPEKMDLPALKEAYLKELEKKGIVADCEIAALDSQGHMVYATNDTAAFKNIRVKTASDLAAMTEAADVEYVQAAFPMVNWYLLKRMVWMLVISIALILICVSSFFYLIAQFFRQKRLSEIRNDFMNNMTHELKTPISSVSVALELIDGAAERGDEGPVKEYIQIAQGELNRLTMLVEKVLKMAAFEKSDIRIVREVFLAAPWIQKITNSFKPIFETRGATCQVDISPELLMLYGDKTHLTNVLQNLIDNAIKYNDKSRPSIHIMITEQEQHVLIRVADNGKGIPESYQKKIFDKFFRVPAGDVHDVKGYGLGLSYIKAVLDLHEGTIGVDSIVGEGSTFTISLPKGNKL